MTNYFGELFLQLQTKIKATCPEIRWIDQDFGQLEEFEIRPEVSFPCVLIDFSEANYEEIATLAQIGNITISFRLGFAPFSHSSNITPLDVKQKALDYYRLEQKLYECLQGFETEFSQGLIRTRAYSEKRQDALRVRVLQFTTSYEDLSAFAQPNKQSIPIGFEIE